MFDRLPLSLSTMPQIAEELSKREHERFLLIYQDADTNEWVIDLSTQLDGLEVIDVLQGFQSRMIQLVREQQIEADVLRDD